MERQIDANLVINELRNIIGVLNYELALERSANKALEKELFTAYDKLKTYEQPIPEPNQKVE